MEENLVVADDQTPSLVALRCRTCGDTFTIHVGDARVCPSCGGTDVTEAHEPLL